MDADDAPLPTCEFACGRGLRRARAVRPRFSSSRTDPILPLSATIQLKDWLASAPRPSAAVRTPFPPFQIEPSAVPVATEALPEDRSVALTALAAAALSASSAAASALYRGRLVGKLLPLVDLAASVQAADISRLAERSTEAAVAAEKAWRLLRGYRQLVTSDLLPFRAVSFEALVAAMEGGTLKLYLKLRAKTESDLAICLSSALAAAECLARAHSEREALRVSSAAADVEALDEAAGYCLAASVAPRPAAVLLSLAALADATRDAAAAQGRVSALSLSGGGNALATVTEALRGEAAALAVLGEAAATASAACAAMLRRVRVTLAQETPAADASAAEAQAAGLRAQAAQLARERRAPAASLLASAPARRAASIERAAALMEEEEVRHCFMRQSCLLLTRSIRS